MAAFDDGELVGTCAAFTFDLTVPGAALPMGGTTMVTVQPSHRRRGALRAMMEAHLEEVCSRNEPLAGLWASESTIYGRFGFGPAAERVRLQLDARTVDFRGNSPPGRIRLIDANEALDALPPLYERIRPDRPGALTRTPSWWEQRVIDDPEHARQGRSAQRIAVYSGASGPEGYVMYRQQQQWKDFPEGEVNLLELIATGPESHAGLWRYVCNIDLYPNVHHWNAPLDDEIPWRVSEARRVRRKVDDSLWLRILDIPRALAGRKYEQRGRLVFGVTDEFRPENSGAYELDATPAGATCRRTGAEPQITLPIAMLGAIYLGGHRATTLGRAGLISGPDDALRLADHLFSWTRLPWCPENF